MKKRRGSREFRCLNILEAPPGCNIIKLKSFDYKYVQVCSTNSCPTSISPLRRCNRAEKKHIEVKCPTMIKEYNPSMRGGLDTANMLMSLCHISITTGRCYLKVLFHCLGITKVNAGISRFIDEPRSPVMQFFQFMESLHL